MAEKEETYRIIKSVMNKKVLTVKKDDNALDAVKKMANKGYSCVVVAEKKMPIGIVTERDFIYKVVVKKKNASKLKVSDIMTTPVKTVSPESDLVPMGMVMKRKKIRRLVVVDEKGKISGIVTETDIVNGIIRLVRHLDWKVVSMEISVEDYFEKLRDAKILRK